MSPQLYYMNIEHLLNHNLDLIIGDFNTHHQLWHSESAVDNRGTTIADQISSFRNGVITTEWQTMVELDSDHIPIIISLDRTIEKTASEDRTLTMEKEHCEKTL